MCSSTLPPPVANGPRSYQRNSAPRPFRAVEFIEQCQACSALSTARPQTESDLHVVLRQRCRRQFVNQFVQADPPRLRERPQPFMLVFQKSNGEGGTHGKTLAHSCDGIQPHRSRVDDCASVEPVRNPLKSAIRWWLAARLPADLEAGDICLVQSSDGGYQVAKLLAVDRSAVHVRLYKQRFFEVPRFVNTAALTMGTVHDTGFGIGHLPISRASFASWRPIRIQHELVAEDELEGYRVWKDAEGGIWD